MGKRYSKAYRIEALKLARELGRLETAKKQEYG